MAERQLAEIAGGARVDTADRQGEVRPGQRDAAADQRPSRVTGPVKARRAD